MRLKILTWNIACLPWFINILTHPIKRVDSIIEVIRSFDAEIVCFQEVFDKKILLILKQYLTLEGYHTAYNNEKNFMISPDGLLIASKYKIIDVYHRSFCCSAGEEKLVKKAVLSIEVDIPFVKSKIVVHNTHLQAQSIFGSLFKKSCDRVLEKQIKSLNEHTMYFKDHFNILCGDLNKDLCKEAYMKKFYKLCVSNEKKLPTDLENKTQTDYIILMMNDIKYKKVKYSMIPEYRHISDHAPLMCRIRF